MKMRGLYFTFATFVLVFTFAVLNPVSGNSNDKNDGKGTWSEWKTTECSATCGSGQTQTFRTYFPGPNDAIKEPFKDIRVFTCTNQAFPQCPRDGIWTGWGSWSDCTKGCGGGERKRNRDCYGMTPGGKECDGEELDEEKCNKEPCPRLPPNFDMSKCSKAANFTCASEKMCILIAEKCDDTVQCHDGSDELKCPVKTRWGQVRYDLRDGASTQSKFGLWFGLVAQSIICFLLTTAVWYH